MWNIKIIARSAIGISVVYFVTALIPAIKIGPGFFNLSDAFVMIIAFMYGPIVGIFSGLGAAIADFILGYQTFIPFTIMAKCSAGYLIGKYADQLRVNSASRTVLPTIAMVYMIFVYIIHDAIVLNLWFVPNHIFGNAMQGVVAIVCLNMFILRSGGRRWDQ